MKGADGQTFAGAVEGDGFLFRVFTFPLLIPPVLLPTIFAVKLILVSGQWSVVSGQWSVGVAATAYCWLL